MNKRDAPGERRRPTILVANPLLLFSESLAAGLRGRHGLLVFGDYPETGDQAIEAASRLKPDVVLMDLYLPPARIGVTIKAITADNPECKVILMSWLIDPQEIQRGLAAGAADFLTEDLSLSEIAKVGLRVVTGGSGEYAAKANQAVQRRLKVSADVLERFESLGKREVEILALLAAGLSAVEIATRLTISRRSVENRISSILRKTATLTSTEAVSQARSCGFLE